MTGGAGRLIAVRTHGTSVNPKLVAAWGVR